MSFVDIFMKWKEIQLISFTFSLFNEITFLKGKTNDYTWLFHQVM